MPPARAPTATAPLLAVADDEEVAVELLPVSELEVVEAGVPSDEEALAAAWKSSKVLSSVGLIAKTIPCSQ